MSQMKRPSLKVALGLIILIGTLLLFRLGLHPFQLSAKESIYEKTRLYMGTFVTVKVVAENAAKAQEIIDAAFGEIEKIEGLMSRYRENSEVSRLNRLAHMTPQVVSPETFEVLMSSGEIFRNSGGAFDATIAPLIKLWQKAAKENHPPRPEKIAQAKALVDYAQVILDEKARTVFFAQPGISLDLGGIAKGCAVDKAVEAIKAHGARAALVDAGGDIYVLGSGPDGSGWRIKIQDPAGGESGLGVVEVKNRAVVTSGNYQRFFEIAGRRYSHIVDPRSGWPAEGVASVTVIAPQATLADGLATALSVLGETEGLKLIESLPDVECLMVVGEKDSFRQVQSSGFSKFLARSSFKGEPTRPPVPQQSPPPNP